MSGCPCGGPAFETCCGPRLSGAKPAETAEALMRSRYTAFARGQVPYLRETQTKPTDDVSWKETERWSKSVTWLALAIVDRQQGGVHDEAGIVEFIAKYLDGDTVHELQERSSFLKRDGRWIYDDGKPTERSQKVERNAPCPCGSGKKFKACHA